MALVFMDSFDHYTSSTDLLTKYASTNEAAINTGGRWGTSAIYNGAYGRGQLRSLQFTSCDTYIIGLAYLSNNAAADFPIISLREGTITHVYVYPVKESRVFRVARGDGTILGTATTLYGVNIWMYLELKVVVHDSAGSFELRMNGTSIVSASGVDTRNGGTGVINEFMLFDTGGSGANDNDNSWMDDLYFCNNIGPVSNNFLGDIRVQYLVPTGVGAKTQFTPSTGSNWQTVDETAPSDTDYNSASTPGAMDLFGMANLSGNGLVYGVQTILRGKKDDAGFRGAKPAFFKANGTGSTDRYYTGTQSPVGDTFYPAPIQIYNTSPDTGVAWTVDEVNALQYGYAVGDAGMFTLDAKLV